MCMRVMGLDIGEKRIGVAIADTATESPFPCASWTRTTCSTRQHALLARSSRTTNPTCSSADCPRRCAGIREVRRDACGTAPSASHRLAGLPLEFADERLSSAEAKRLLREQGLSEREMRGKVDSVAASLFLEMWIARNGEDKMEER